MLDSYEKDSFEAIIENITFYISASMKPILVLWTVWMQISTTFLFLISFSFSLSFLICRYFSNITMSGKDYSFNNEGYLANPFLDVISYTPGSGWEDVRDFVFI